MESVLSTRSVLAATALLGGWLALGAASVAQTHVGVPVEDLVNLMVASSPGDSCAGVSFADLALFRRLPDGSVEAQPFVVPPGRALVITDALINAGPSTLDQQWDAGRSLVVALWTTGPAGEAPLLWAAAVPILDEFDGQSQIMGAQVHLTGGAVVEEGLGVCVTASETQQSTSGAARVRADTTVHGYLVTPGQQVSLLAVPAVAPHGLAVLALGLLGGGLAILRRCPTRAGA